MHKTLTLRFYPTTSQKTKVSKILGASRLVYNLFLEYNWNLYNSSGRYIGNYEFDKLFNCAKNDSGVFLGKDISFLREDKIYSKALKKTMENADIAFKRFFKGLSKFPRYKSKFKNPIKSVYFVNNTAKRKDIRFKSNNIIKIPIMGNCRIRHGYTMLPEQIAIVSGRIMYEHGKYFIKIIYESDKIKLKPKAPPCGIDVGIEKYCTIYFKSGEYVMKESFLKQKNYVECEEKIKFFQRIINKKQDINYNRLVDTYKSNHGGEEPSDDYKKIMKGGAYNTGGIRKVRNKLLRLYFRRRNIVKDFLRKLVFKIVARTKPEYITIENINVRQMLENDSSHTLHDHIAKSNFYYFRNLLEMKCKELGIELRIADKYFASSKTCSSCGEKNKKLTLADRWFYCECCGNGLDRDLNAAINLCNTDKYNLV